MAEDKSTTMKALPKGRDSLYYLQGWTCPKCGLSNGERTCEQCGYKRPSLLRRMFGESEQ